MERLFINRLTRAFIHISIICDPRALKDVLKHIKDAFPRDLRIVKWKEKRKALYIKI
jgi:hypothetical protein